MAVVVDTSVSVIVFRPRTSFPILADWLFGDQGALAVCERQLDEIDCSDVLRAVAILRDAGKILYVKRDDIDDEFKGDWRHTCASDDPHIVALMRTSGVRLICTADRKLRADVVNRALMDNPRGKVYGNLIPDGPRTSCVEPERRAAERLLRDYGPLGTL